VPDSDIAMRQYMKEVPPDELMGTDRHGLLLIPIGVIAPTEGDPTAVKLEDAIITDGDSVGIPAEVL